MEIGQLQSEVNSSKSIEGRYLTFILKGNSYGVPIVRVQEIIGVCPITAVPKSRPYLKGIMNLRGKVIPVVDLRLLLGLPTQEHTEKTCFVVVNSSVDGESLSCGLIVDQVNEVIDLDSDGLTGSDFSRDPQSNNFLMGFGRCEQTVAMLIDIDGMFERIVAERKVGFKES